MLSLFLAIIFCEACLAQCCLMFPAWFQHMVEMCIPYTCHVPSTFLEYVLHVSNMTSNTYMSIWIRACAKHISRCNPILFCLPMHVELSFKPKTAENEQECQRNEQMQHQEGHGRWKRTNQRKHDCRIMRCAILRCLSMFRCLPQTRCL